MKYERTRIQIPMQGAFTKKPKDPCEVEGLSIGCFVAHEAPPPFEGTWSVTHKSTGFSAKQDLHSERAAICLAEKLVTLDCWDFTDPKDVKKMDPAVLVQVMAWRSEAAIMDGGGCHGD